MPEETTKEHSLEDFDLEKLPTDTEKMEEFMKDHASDKYPAAAVEKKFGSKFGEVSGNVIGFIFALMMEQASRYTGKLIEFVKLHRLNDEALPKIQFKKNKLEENIAKKWEELKKLHPEIESFQAEAKAEDEAKDVTKKKFKEWASKISPEEKKRLKEEYKLTPENAYTYKKIYDRHQNSMAEKNPNPILKLPTPLFHPTQTTSSITKQGKTDQEYSKQFNDQSESTKKSIFRHDRKLTKETKKLKKKEGVAKKTTRYREKFKRMYAYLFDNNLKNTPIDYAAANVASQVYNKSKKDEEKGNYNPNDAAIAVAELAILTEDPPPIPDEPPPPYEETEEAPPGYESSTTPSTHSQSNMQQQLRNLLSQNSNNPLNSHHSSKYRKVARKLRKKGKKVTGKAVRKVGQRGVAWFSRLGARSCCSGGSCFVLIIVIFIIVIMLSALALVLGLLS